MTMFRSGLSFTPPVLVLFILLLLPRPGFCDQHNLAIGYGFGELNKNTEFGRLRGDNGYYDFAVLTYGYEKQMAGTLNLLIEPFAAFINRPATGLDGGMGIGGRYYFGANNHTGFFVTAATGPAYTSVAFCEQGTHFLFMLQGGIGYKWKTFSVENRFRHYSNGGLASPNRAVNANIVTVGWVF